MYFCGVCDGVHTREAKGCDGLRRPPLADPVEELERYLLAPENEGPRTMKGIGHLFAHPTPSALATQVGGDHYKKLKIQPMEYSMANGLDACQHTVVKYVTRFRDKGGIADLEKAKHTIDLLIELEAKLSAPRS
jgi:hypothetical protein